jgi:nitroreductase
MGGRFGLEAWAVEPTSYPLGGPVPDQLRAAVGWAVLAPSSHNSQPWLFDVRENGVDVVADRSRALPVVDPDDRELIISVGAGVATLAVVIRRFGHDAAVAWWPDHDDVDLVARVTLGAEFEPSAADLQRFAAVTRRCTNRGPYVDQPVPNGLLERLALDAAAEGAHIEWVEGPDRHGVADLVAEGDLMQMHDRMFRRELAAWTTANRSKRLDGIRGYTVGVHDLASNFGPLAIRTFDLGRGQAARDAALAEGCPALAVIDTPGDSPQDWAAAGAALVAVLLRLTGDGYAASFLNQPIEVPGLRERVAEEFGAAGVPQLLLRIGQPGEAMEHTPRRCVGDVLIDHDMTVSV